PRGQPRCRLEIALPRVAAQTSEATGDGPHREPRRREPRRQFPPREGRRDRRSGPRTGRERSDRGRAATVAKPIDEDPSGASSLARLREEALRLELRERLRERAGER